jgi:exosome complex exonuclease DIS3/RRP44
MMQAVYFCSGTAAPHDYLHYGLATDLYTHFTSPIRRYADIIVHRQLAVAIDSAEASVTPDIINQSSMKELCDNINYRHRMAQHAGRSSVELFTLLFFQNRNIVEEGFVTRILKNGFIVLIPKYGIEGIVYASNASKVQLLSYNPQSDTLEHGQHAIALFQKVTVMVSIEDDKRAGGDGGMRQKLQLTLLDPWIEGLAALTRDKAQAYVRESRLKRDAVQRDEERLAKKIKAQQIE